MSALAFDPWATLKIEAKNGLGAKSANVANQEAIAAGSGLATLAGLAETLSASLQTADIYPDALADAAAERAAIIAVDGGTDPGRWRLVDHMRHAAHLRGLQDAANMRPPSWSGSAPRAGYWCSCCRGRAWWSRSDQQGWCCAVCHPPLSEQYPERLIRVAT